MVDNQNIENGTRGTTVPAEETLLDTIVWEDAGRVRNRIFPGPGLYVRVLRREGTASFTFSPDLVQALGLTDGCRLIFGWDPKNRRLGIMKGFGSKVRLLRSGNVEVSKVLAVDILNDLLGDREERFFKPMIVPGAQIMVITATTAHDPWSTGTMADPVAPIPLLQNDVSPDPTESGRVRSLIQIGGRGPNVGHRHPTEA